MPTRAFGFGTGIIKNKKKLGDKTVSMLIKLDRGGSPVQVWTTPCSRMSSYMFAGGIRVHSPVICSWYTEKDGLPLLEISAVETASRWRRQTSYEPRFPHGAGNGSSGQQAEHWCLAKLREAGIRTEHATAFEDERLGIDLWVLMHTGRRWRWFPVDVSLKPVAPLCSCPGSKFVQAAKRGVIPVQLLPEMEHWEPDELARYFISQLRTNVRPLEGKIQGALPPLDRQTARDWEVKYKPNLERPTTAR